MIDYPHEQTIHCENGAIRNIFKYHHYELSEPLIFGIGSGIAFTHVPFMSMEGFRLTMTRPSPVSIFKNLSKVLGIKLYHRYFLSKKRAMKTLDELLEQNIPVGLVVNISNLSYFPSELRGNFNGHHIVVYGKEGNNYYVSDTLPELPDGREIITAEEMKTVRFSDDILSPRGSLFYIKELPKELPIEKGIWGGIRKTCKDMLHPSLRYFGIKGMFLLSREMHQWERHFDFAEKKANLRQLVRLFEEAGTGGAAFRFLYAQFLKEAATVTKQEALAVLSDTLRGIAEKWQNMSLQMLRYTKSVNPEKCPISMLEIADLMKEIAEAEQSFFQKLACVQPSA